MCRKDESFNLVVLRCLGTSVNIGVEHWMEWHGNLIKCLAGYSKNELEETQTLDESELKASCKNAPTKLSVYQSKDLRRIRENCSSIRQ